jgi:pyrimidine-nucleoside phosphorylase
VSDEHPAPLDLRSFLGALRAGQAPPAGAIERFIQAVTEERVDRAHLGAFLALVFVRGLEPQALLELTRAMVHSGDVLDLEGLGRPVVDKHSTGGIGDKVSLPLAPALVAAGCAVPMISGRGLGHTGGTLDKLEAIPGFQTAVDPAEYRTRLERFGLVFGGQTSRIAPADRILYATRDVTGLVESIPLITSSILSKKLAENLDGLVLDVKFGSGAFLPEIERGEALARALVETAQAFGVRAVAWLSNMQRPLGRTIGHSLEVEESVHCLAGHGPSDLRELVCLLGGEALALVGIADSPGEGALRIARCLDDGSAFQVFERVVEAQGGDPRALTDTTLLGTAAQVARHEASAAGYVHFPDLRAFGRALLQLGGARRAVGEAIDLGVGVRLLVDEGQRVELGTPLLEIHHRGTGLDPARAELEGAIAVAAEPPRRQPLALRRIPASEG